MKNKKTNKSVAWPGYWRATDWRYLVQFMEENGVNLADKALKNGRLDSKEPKLR